MGKHSNGVSDEETGTADLTESERHRLLASERRRLILEILAERSPPVRLEELSATVADRERGDDRRGADVEDRIAITLHHHHLPKMNALGVLEYDPTVNRVESIRVRPPP